ncbi:MAG: FecR domain-containing protein [Candidatus Riflebacteria bacterium]|nr:FecR domain-containing protein [Candidatus Riflebacteria bacterium]
MEIINAGEENIQTPQQREAFFEHAQNCSSCSKALAVLDEIRRGYENLLPDSENLEKFQQRVFKQLQLNRKQSLIIPKSGVFPKIFPIVAFIFLVLFFIAWTRMSNQTKFQSSNIPGVASQPIVFPPFVIAEGKKVRILQPSGLVQMQRTSSSTLSNAKENDELLPGGTIHTWANGGARLVYPDESGITILPDTYFEVRVGQCLGFQAQGTVIYSVKPNKLGVTVETPHGVIAVLGTTFRISVASDGTAIWVNEGHVSFTSVTGDQQHLRAGQSLHYSGTGKVPLPIQIDAIGRESWASSPSGKLIIPVTSSFSRFVPSQYPKQTSSSPNSGSILENQTGVASNASGNSPEIRGTSDGF